MNGQESNSQESNSQKSKVEILVVDDSRTQVELLKYLLELQEYKVTVATNGQEALQRAKENRPTLIISDIVMPIMDGYEMCARLKQEPDFESVPVILLTQLAEPEDIVRGLHAQADYYLTKPYKPEYLLSKVKTLIENPPAMRERQTETDLEGLHITLDGKNYVVNADRQQMMNLLFSTYENAVQQNRELASTQLELKATNEQLHEQMSLLEDAREQLEQKQTLLMEVNIKLEALAVTDGLTGLKNYRAFQEKLAEYFRYGARYDAAPFSIALLDVDRFKQFNDTYGHPQGDGVLIRVGQILTQTIRESDFVARYGGEEFVVLLHTDSREASVLAERLRYAIESEPWMLRPITVSIGIATATPETQIPESEYSDPITDGLNHAALELVTAADRALYASKASGRNRWTHASVLS
jgi:diguanylate cyclase (GGDEF)-like protein